VARSDRQRRHAIRGAYVTLRPIGPERRLLLVDDVVTTGATLGDLCRRPALCWRARHRRARASRREPLIFGHDSSSGADEIRR
jgi:hypothetical protein